MFPGLQNSSQKKEHQNLSLQQKKQLNTLGQISIC